jgi:pimeloyl-ACP methyl ester carboxylesterase
MIRVVKQYYKTLSAVSPKLAANSAFELFKKVRKKDIRDQEKPFYTEAKHKNLVIDGQEIHSYEFGNPNDDIVVLLHGWDSNVGCMYKFVEPLLAKNKYVVSFNLPGHAFYESSKTNLFEAKETFKKYIGHLPKGRKISIISHSFGSAVSGYGLSELDLEIEELVFLTSPNKIMDIFNDYQRMIGLNDKSFGVFLAKADMVLGENVTGLNIENKLEEANFKHLYLFHDEQDKVLPYHNSVAIHDRINHSSLYTFQKIGHYRMLWNDELIKKVMEVIK